MFDAGTRQGLALSGEEVADRTFVGLCPLQTDWLVYTKFKTIEILERHTARDPANPPNNGEQFPLDDFSRKEKTLK